MPTVKTVYVDPDAVGSNNGTSWTDAYTGLGTWTASETVLDLVTNDTQINVLCRNSSGGTDTTNLDLTAFTTDATRYIHAKVETAYQHAGVPGAGYIISQGASATWTLWPNQPYTILEGFEAHNTRTTGGGLYGPIYVGSHALIINCIGKCWNNFQCISLWGGSAGQEATAINCIAFDSPNQGYSIGSSYRGRHAYNCGAFDNGSNGFLDGNAIRAELNLYNCVAYGNNSGGKQYEATGDTITGTHNATQLANSTAEPDMPTTGAVYGITGTAGDDFTDQANDDWSIPNTSSALYNAGTSLAATHAAAWYGGLVPHDLDIAGNTRSQWDIGPFAYVAAGATYTADLTTGTFTISGQEATALRGLVADLNAGSFSLSGQDLTVLRGLVADLNAGSFSLNGQTLDVTHNTGATYIADLLVGAFTLSGQDLTVLRGLVADLGPGSFTLTGLDPTVSFTRKANLTTGTYSLSGKSITTSYARVVELEPGTFIIMGGEPEVIWSGEVAPPTPYPYAYDPLALLPDNVFPTPAYIDAIVNFVDTNYRLPTPAEVEAITRAAVNHGSTTARLPDGFGGRDWNNQRWLRELVRRNS